MTIEATIIWPDHVSHYALVGDYVYSCVDHHRHQVMDCGVGRAGSTLMCAYTRDESGLRKTLIDWMRRRHAVEMRRMGVGVTGWRVVEGWHDETRG